MKKILIVTSKADLHSDYISERLAEKGVEYVRFDADELVRDLFVSYTEKSGHCVWQTKGGNKQILFVSGEISAVWYRKPFITKYDRVHQETTIAFAGRETDAYLRDWNICFPVNCKWVNHPDANRAADNKLYQLRLAKKLGFQTPRTLASNDPDAVKDFANQLAPKKMIYKTLSHPFISETANLFRSVFTSVVELSPQLEDSVRLAPCLFQECVEKAYELRVTVVGAKTFTTRIFSQDQA